MVIEVVRQRPLALNDSSTTSSSSNSPIWLLRHVARTEDAAVDPVVADRDQVLDDEWMRRMNLYGASSGPG